MINAVREAAKAGFMMLAGAARSDKNGSFTLSNVAPGDYTLQTRGMQIMTTGAGDNMTVNMRFGGPDGGDAEAGSLPITVSGEDLASVGDPHVQGSDRERPPVVRRRHEAGQPRRASASRPPRPTATPGALLHGRRFGRR